MVEHRYTSNDYPGAFGGFEWSGDVTDLLHTPGWFVDHVREVSLGCVQPFTGLQKLFFTTTDNHFCVADPWDIVLFRLGRLVVCKPDIVRFFLKELI